MNAGLRSLAVCALLLLMIVALMAGCGKAAPEIELATVPELAGLSRGEAEGLLEAAGLVTGESQEVFSDSVPPGMIIYTDPSSGEELEKGSSVNFAFSKGPEMLAIPSLVGVAESDALASLQALGFKVEVQPVYSESIAAGLICGMEPASETAVKTGALVTLSVSLGSAYVTCGTCGGSGTVKTTVTCPDCGGTGWCDT
jgi:beta-lactam-binding protein with PASTA domain